jgi:hypothetical protein
LSSTPSTAKKKRKVRGFGQEHKLIRNSVVRQEDGEFEASLSYVTRFCLKKNQNNFFLIKK